jgi:hypothetical protein
MERIVKSLFYDVPMDIYFKLRKKGTWQILHEWGQDEGIEKILAILDWALPLLHSRFACSQDPFLLAVQQTRWFFLGTKCVRSLQNHFLNDTRDGLKLPQKHPISPFFLTTSHFIEAYQTLKKLDLIEIQFFGLLSARLSQYRLFQLPLFNLIPQQPKTFFIGVGVVLALLEILFFYCTKKRDSKQASETPPSFTFPFLKGIIYGGKLIQVLGKVYQRSSISKAAYGTSLLSHLILYSIKSN